jgi:hypothetical protein
MWTSVGGGDGRDSGSNDRGSGSGRDDDSGIAVGMLVRK